ncbi:MAG: nucleotidyltransferase family protein, partial [Pseudomonadota bacterium]
LPHGRGAALTVRPIILAGQRLGPDALCQHAGVTFKADIPVGGVAMLDRVAAALRAAGLPDPIALSGYPDARTGFEMTGSGTGPADSALAAAQDGPFPALLTTCDHALLTPEMVRDFLRDAQASDADFAVGLASRHCIEAAYPETKRTYMTFSDIAVSGCNLFYIGHARGLGAIEFWREAQHLRKKPMRLAAKIGSRITVRYALRRLSLADAFDYASRRIGASVAPVLIDHAEAAIDVDKPSDLELVERIVAARDASAKAG